ncbi:MAG: cob(I)yrinic acid a,c-diamide adenosyltransferase [Deltaproteobacteria bacterium]|nr:cob(I)yrinic acid a,c-diamide adenosyltransferase [Deltaproteobacteria bacterium]
MKIYTKTGDQGETGLFGGGRVKKSHPRIIAYGTVDELNAHLGQIRSKNPEASVDRLLDRIQNDLFTLGAELATPGGEKLSGRGVSGLGDSDIHFLEETIDHYDEDLPPLKNFILPGGSDLAVSLHLARTVCRRAEREVVFLSENEVIENSILVYLNRLSDLLFVLARWVNFKQSIPETAWIKR